MFTNFVFLFQEAKSQSKETEEPMDTIASLPEVPAGPLTRARGKVQKQDTMAELEAWAAAN